MTWQGISGHNVVAERFARIAAHGRLPCAFLFVGPPGTGKRSFAIEVARVLLCSGRDATSISNGTLAGFTACGHCPDCLQVTEGVHPDLMCISRPEGKSTIPVELLIGAQDKRMRTGLLHDLSLKSFRGRWKIAIIDDADDLAAEGANALLKTLEEPPPQAMLILIGTSADKQLPTIRSRCQIMRFTPLADDVMRRLVIEQQIAENTEQAETMTAFSGGSLTKARQLADPDVFSFREQLLRLLAQADFNPDELASGVQAFADAAGKEAPPRRARTKLALDFALELFRQIARVASGSEVQADSELQSCVAARLGSAPIGAETCVRVAERTLDAWEEVDRNANLANVIACWADEVWRMSRATVQRAAAR
ncbi:MAG: DNA polymerase III subunit [Pirellulales bacterium]|nr:DNA polymerase III subunit [Pirellulales bacterium]